MSNVVVNPGWEENSTWSYRCGSQRKSGGYAGDWRGFCGYNGLFACFMGWYPRVYQGSLSLTEGGEYPVSVYVRSVGANHGTLTVKVDKGDGSPVTLGTKSDAAAAWTLWDLGSFTALGPDGSIEFTCDNLIHDDQGWDLDDASIEGTEVDMFTTNLKAALLTDLAAIDGTGVFQMTVAGTGGEPVRLVEAKTPGLYLNSSSGASDIATLTNRKGDTEQRFTIDMVVESSTPNADMDKLLDDIRNACEVSTSNLYGVSGVANVVVTDWTEVLTDPDTAAGYAFRQVEIAVQYFYSRGSV